MNVRNLFARAQDLAAAARPGVLGAAAWAWRHRTLVLAVLVALLTVLLFRACGRANEAEAEIAAAAARAEEEARARRADVPIVQQVPQAVVDAEAARALAERPELEAARRRLEREVGRLRATLAIRAETPAGPAQGPERPGEAGTGRSVLLRAGDDLRLTLHGLGLEAQQGAQALLASVAVERTADGAELYRSALSVPLSEVYGVLPPAPERARAASDRPWRLGIVGGGAADLDGAGWVAGVAAARRFRIWRWEPELLGAAAGGPGGIVLLGGVLF